MSPGGCQHHAQQLAVESTDPHGIVDSSQVYKHNINFFSVPQFLPNVIGQKHNLVGGGATMTEADLLLWELQIDHRL